LCQVGWVSFGWWTILDTHGKLEHEKPSSVAVLGTLKPVLLAPTTIPLSKALKSRLAYSPSEWHTYTIHVSIVLHFIYTD
jgi:hypothetical protein